MEKNKSVDAYIEKHNERRKELKTLRDIILSLPYVETIKWGMPTYMLDGKNIVGIGSFKDWSCLWFHQGVLLSDPKKVLINAQKGKTVAMRQWRFSDLNAIDEKLVRQYLEEAIDKHENGETVNFPQKKNHKVAEQPIPNILKEFLEQEPALMEKFDKYTVAQRNAFINFIDEVKRKSTKLDRLERIKPLINSGKKLQELWN